MTPTRKVASSLLAPLVSPAILLAVGWFQLVSLKDCGPGCAGGVGPVFLLFVAFAVFTYPAFVFACLRAAKRPHSSLGELMAFPLVVSIALSAVLAVGAFVFSTPANVLAELAFVLCPVVITAGVYGLWWLLTVPHNSALQATR